MVVGLAGWEQLGCEVELDPLLPLVDSQNGPVRKQVDGLLVRFARNGDV